MDYDKPSISIDSDCSSYITCLDAADCRDEVSDRLQLIRMDFTDCCRQNEAGVNVPKLSLSNRTYLIRKANAIRQEQQVTRCSLFSYLSTQ